MGILSGYKPNADTVPHEFADTGGIPTPASSVPGQVDDPAADYTLTESHGRVRVDRDADLTIPAEAEANYTRMVNAGEVTWDELADRFHDDDLRLSRWCKAQKDGGREARKARAEAVKVSQRNDAKLAEAEADETVARERARAADPALHGHAEHDDTEHDDTEETPVANADEHKAAGTERAKAAKATKAAPTTPADRHAPGAEKHSA